MDVQWDPAKAVTNWHKHRVTFEDAVRVFYDVGRIEAHDGRDDYGEDRWVTIGLVYPAVLYVVFAMRSGDSVRLISARNANEKERRQYRQANP